MKLIQSLFRKKAPKENALKYMLYLLHLWIGLLFGGIISFTCLTGAIYVFKSEVENLSNRSHYNRTEATSSTDNIEAKISNYELKYKLSPSSILIPQNPLRNIKISGGGRGKPSVVAFADRQTDDIIGEQSSNVSTFFITIMKLHRWFNINNHNVGKQIVAGCTILFILLLISGIVLWFPKNKSKNKWQNKFKIRFKQKFIIFNRDLHINLGTIVAIPLLLIAWTGVYFTYPAVRESTLALFMSQEERAIATKQKQAPNEKPQKADIPQTEDTEINYTQIIEQTNKEYNYAGDISIHLPSRRNPHITARKLNKNNLLGAMIYDQITFKPQGEPIEIKPFSSLANSQKARMLMKSIHTGEIFGLKSKILYFILVLIAAYLPISGYIMWWKRLNRKKRFSN